VVLIAATRAYHHSGSILGLLVPAECCADSAVIPPGVGREASKSGPIGT
jgi:hypothetical protein